MVVRPVSPFVLSELVGNSLTTASLVSLRHQAGLECSFRITRNSTIQGRCLLSVVFALSFNVRFSVVVGYSRSYLGLSESVGLCELSRSQESWTPWNATSGSPSFRRWLVPLQIPVVYLKLASPDPSLLIHRKVSDTDLEGP